ncbi:hypothetical protein [Azonexus sp. IMCC34839]|uniref:hypothetical protein n=1 Tax=Azonexus sp. IMCC34839 TaxID=3133695 RepID=UPI00399B3F2A
MSDSLKDKFLATPECHVKRAFESLEGDLLLLERQYRRLNLPAIFRSMAMAHEDLGLIASYAHHDMTAFKQHWSVVSKLRVHAARHEPDSENYVSGGTMSQEMELLYAFVSDDPAAIEEVAALDTPRLIRYQNDAKAREFTFHLAQLVIRGDYEAAHAEIEHGAKKAGGSLKKAYATGTDFYSLLMKGDKAGLEASIMDYTKQEEKNTLPTLCDFIRPVSTFRAKLCWQKGIPVEIEHPMVPMAWMPIAPLSHYDDIYDFFAPDWTPPDQSLFARVTRKFQRNYPAVEACMERVRRIDMMRSVTNSQKTEPPL